MATISPNPLSGFTESDAIHRNNARGDVSRSATSRGSSFDEALAGMGVSTRGDSTSTSRTEPPTPAAQPETPKPLFEAEGPFMMPMQQSWTPPVIPPSTSEYRLHPIYGVPMVSEATLNRYIHPLQSVGAILPDSTAETPSAGDIGTTVYRVAPDGEQDFVTSDGFRHRFDVEIVFPSPSSGMWQGYDALKMHPEVADYASEQLLNHLNEAGISTAGMSITPYRMIGGTPDRPWFLDQLVIHTEGNQDLAVSLNVAMRDPQYTIDTIRDFLDSPLIPS